MLSDPSFKRIDQLKNAFDLRPHPEGGFYAEQYRSSDTIISPKNKYQRSTLTHIYFLLTENDISRWHKVIHDEIWHVYEGDPLRILSFDELQETPIEDEVIGGMGRDISTHYYKVIKGGTFQAAQTTGLYTFMGCCVAPGFDFEDFSYIESEVTKTWVKEQGKDFGKFI
jgi:predicted cupin superfamily sugar epimerase